MTAEAFANRPFTAKSKEVVQRFLQSVVALDDLAWMGFSARTAARGNNPHFECARFRSHVVQ